mgnify:CR=1 FL=1
MLRILKLKGRTGRFDVPSFPWTENEPLIVKFDVNESRFGRYMLIVKCGNMQKTVMLNPKEMTVEIEPEFIKNGNYGPVYFLLEFRNPVGDKIIIPNDPKKNGFFIEPLYITRVEGNTTGFAWLTKIETALAEIQETLKMHGETLNGVPALIDQAKRDAIVEATGYDPMNG